MKRWQQILTACLLFIFYLLAGAFIFRTIELPQELLLRENLSRSKEEFLASHPCVSKEELYEYSQTVVEAVDSGVVHVVHDVHEKQAIDHPPGEQSVAWDLPNSFFFSATIVTTIGYGDLTPQTTLGKFVCMVYGLIGLPLTAWVIGVISRSLTAYWTKALDKADGFLLICVKFARLRKAIMIFITILVLYAILLQVPAVLLGYIEQWGLVDAVYYCFITLTTIGFGDLVVGNHADSSQAAKWALKTCMVLYVMFGLSLLVALTSAISERANKTIQKSLMPGNSYHIDEDTQSKKMRKRRNTMIENEIVLRHIPDLSSARMRSSKSIPSCKVLEKKQKGVDDWIEMQSLSNLMDEGDVPPCYEEVVIDLSISDSTSMADLALHRTSLDNGHHIERNGSISIISNNEYGHVTFDGPSH